MAAVLGVMCVPGMVRGESIVLMHTNDTHSQIYPTDEGTGGVARCKVLIDSIRGAEPYALLLDAGDAVQGTAFFNLYKGEVEAMLLNALGYDVVTLGNHEFDNGMERLGEYVRSVDAGFVSTNYRFGGTPMEGLTRPYRIFDIAGKRVGVLAINVEPAGMIDPDKSVGVRYLDPLKAANATAWHLRNNEGCDYVVALTHIGYEYEETFDDRELAAASSDIDVIIGGHSHTTVPAGTRVTNAEGRPVVITQTGSQGNALGVVKIDTATGAITDELIAVDSRLDGRVDPAVEEMLKPYRHGVDSLCSIVIGKTRIDTPDRKNDVMVGFVARFLAARGRELAPDVTIDLAMANRGGIRRGMRRGNVTKGQILEMLPFDNRVVVLEVKGRDLLEAFEINERLGRVGYDRPVAMVREGGDVPLSATIGGKRVDPDATYYVATIDYIAKGGDYMKPMKRGVVVGRSDKIMNEDVIEYVEKVKVIK